MLKFLIRLDDACPNMKLANWLRMEALLEGYKVKPIVGIIPDSKDSSFEFPEITDFWELHALRYQEQGWAIAQHGVNHNVQQNGLIELVGLSLEEQLARIKQGNELLRSRGLIPTIYFARGHKFDANTVLACRDSGLFEYISDGRALYPYYSTNMLFVPSLFDSPYKILPFGVYTFVMHPNYMTESQFKQLEAFIKGNAQSFINPHEIHSGSPYIKPRYPINLALTGGIQLMRRAKRLLK